METSINNKELENTIVRSILKCFYTQKLLTEIEYKRILKTSSQVINTLIIIQERAMYMCSRLFMNKVSIIAPTKADGIFQRSLAELNVKRVAAYARVSTQSDE